MTHRAIRARAPRHLLHRLLEAPDLARVVPRLAPKALHQLVQECGLEDCSDVVALATAEQLVRIFDDDLWRVEAGQEEAFDADRFGLWLEVLAEAGAAAAAQKMVEMGLDFVTAAVSRHVLVLDQETMLLGQSTAANADDFDPLENARAVLEENALDRGPSADLGGYHVVARSDASWDALLAILICMEADHGEFFDALMKRCGSLSTEYIEGNGGRFDVLTADEQVMADIAEDRERRRDEEGYVAPSQAVAFLRLARERRASGTPPAASDPVSVRYFRELDPGRGTRGEDASATRNPRRREQRLRVAGVGPRPGSPLSLKGRPDGGSRLARIGSQLRFVEEHDGDAYARRSEELAYLANVLIAGCSTDSRRFRPGEAADAVLAACNLGLENWPHPASLATATSAPVDLLLRQDLVTVFRTGWSVLYERVSLHVARRLAEILSELAHDDHEVRDDIRELGQRLQRQVGEGTPWRERENLEVIAILDPPSWSILVGLLDECPVVPRLEDAAATPLPLRVDSTREFISENAQIHWVQDFLESLPARLTEP